jgi:hypothetical protein
MPRGESISIARCEHKPYDVPLSRYETILILSYTMRSAKLVREFLHDPISTLQNISHKYGDLSHFKLGR